MPRQAAKQAARCLPPPCLSASKQHQTYPRQRLEPRVGCQDGVACCACRCHISTASLSISAASRRQLVSHQAKVIYFCVPAFCSADRTGIEHGEAAAAGARGGRGVQRGRGAGAVG